MEQNDSRCNESEIHKKDQNIKESNKDEDNKKANDIDYILENIVGGGGWGQWMILMCYFPIGIASGLPLLIQMFAAFEPRHRCFVPYCDDPYSSNKIQSAFVDYALPKEYGSSEIFREDEDFDPCKMFEFVGNGNLTTQTCNAESFQNSSVIKCDQFVYDTSMFEETLTTKFDLVCDAESERRLLGTLMMLGLLIGSLIGGRLGDRFGRKITLLLSQVVMTPAVMFGGYSPNYTIYAILRLVSATCLPPMWISSHSLILEVFGKEYRRSVVMVKDFINPIAQLILVLIIYNSRHWTYIHLWAGVACLVPFPCYYFIPESPRWLAINGRLEQAEQILLTIACRNGKKLAEDDRTEVKTTLISIQNGANKLQGQENLNPFDMFRRGHLMKTLILLFNWITVCVGGYTLLLNATKLHGDVFINYTLVVLAGDLPGTAAMLVTLRYFGRRFNLFYTQFILGSCCVILAILPKSYNYGITFFYLLGKCFGGAGFLLVWLITAELYPTNLRSQAIGTCSTVSRVFGLVAPFVAELAQIWKPLPMLILGVPSIIAAFLAYFIPETKNIELPTTMKDADQLENNKLENKKLLVPKSSVK